MQTREIARNIGFTEGPLWLGDGRIAVTATSRGLVTTVALAGGVLGSVECGGGPNGLARDAAGRIHVAQNPTFRTRSLRPAAAGIQVIEDDAVHDVPLPESVAPNDCAFGPDGALWFTDPGRDDARGLSPRIRRWMPGDAVASTVADGLPFPNGLAFSADGATLYVADSRQDRLLAYPVDGPSLGSPAVVAELPGSEPDGIALDRAGAIYVAAFGSHEVIVVEPGGDVIERIPMGDGASPTNLCFAGGRLDTLVVTLARGGRVVAVDGGFEGLPL